MVHSSKCKVCLFYNNGNSSYEVKRSLPDIGRGVSVVLSWKETGESPPVRPSNHKLGIEPESFFETQASVVRGRNIYLCI